MEKLFIVVNVDSFFLSHRKDIAVAALDKGYDVTIVAKDTGFKEKIIDLGLDFINLPINKTGMNLYQELKTFSFLYKLYKKEKPDIVHHVGMKIMLWGGLAAKLTNVKGVLNAVSGCGVFFSDEHINSPITKMLLKVFRFIHNRNNLKVIFQNSEDKALFIKNKVINDFQCSMIKGSGVDLDIFNYTPETSDGRIKVILTARMVLDKGVLVLVDAANQLKEKYHDKVQFILCGGLDTNPNAIKKETLESVCDGEYILWLGHRTDVKDLLKSSHIVAFPSYYKEGLPKSLIEATAIGRPIITTNSVGCKEAVIDGYNGFLIPIKDSVSLADKLEILISDAKLRVNMGNNSRKLAEKEFSVLNVVDKHLKLYNTLLLHEKY
nr:glycosyltransferase family 4 protein [uncultured Bacteroides sp.]